MKRFDVAELEIDPDGRVTGTPPQRSNDALARARRQVEGRRLGMSATNRTSSSMCQGEGFGTSPPVGRQLQTLLEASTVRYDHVYVQTCMYRTEISWCRSSSGAVWLRVLGRVISKAF